MILWLNESATDRRTTPRRRFESGAGCGATGPSPRKVSALDFFTRSFCVGVFVAAVAEAIAQAVTQ